MRVLVLGAFGFIGSHVASALTAAGHEVIWAGRRARADRPSTAVDLARDTDPASWASRLVGVEVVVNCAGILRERGSTTFQAVHVDGPRALFAACEQCGVRRVVQVSAAGAGADVPIDYASTKAEGDALLAASNLDWVVVRPSLVVGRGSQGTAQFAALAALPFGVPLVDEGKQPVQPIAVEDLARSIVAFVEHPGALRTVVEAVGPSPIAMRDLIAVFRAWLGLKPTFFVRVPPVAIGLFARIGDWFGRGPYNTTAIRMLERGSTGDYAHFRAVASIDIPDIRHALALRPAQREDLLLARLFLIRPLLRGSIALLWIVTGFLSAFVWPAEDSYAMLRPVGIDGPLLPLALYGAALTDLALGVATLLSYRIVWVGLLQIALMVGYSVIIAFALPEYWLHPFGPVLKNIPIVAATLVMIALEDRR